MNKSHKCKYCGKLFNRLSNLNRHILIAHEEIRRTQKKQLKCSVCSLQVNKQCYLIGHMRTHTGERPFKCTLDGCGMEFKLKFHLNRHVKFKHSSDRPLKCDFPGCLHTSKTSSNLMSHKKFVHSDDRPFACSHSGCNFRCKAKEVLSRHTAAVHSNLKPFSCSKCNHRTNYARNLALHMIVHEGRNQKILCSIEGCEYVGKNKKALNRHMSLHKPCQVSDRHRKNALKNHLKLHNSSSRPFQCPFCSKHFSTLVQLQRHCFVHTNEKPFECGHCDYAASFRSLVKTHISRAHAHVEFPSILYLLDDRECLKCKITMTTAEFVVHSKSHYR